MTQLTRIGKHATTVTQDQDVTIVTYHDTPVVTVTHGAIILQNGGYYTVTTKARMNQASNELGLGFMVYQEDFQWYVSFKGQDYWLGAKDDGGFKIALSR